MAKKKKKPHRPEAPALSKLDTAIYIVWIGLCTLGVVLGMVWALESISDYFLAQNPDMLICRHTRILFCVVFPCLAVFPGFMLSVAPFSMKQPIFGRTDISYGYPYDASLYPLFFHKRQTRAPAAAAMRWQKQMKANAVWIALLLLLLFFLGALGACPRYELEADGSMTHYNSFNRATRYEFRDLASVELDTDYYVTKNSSGWRVLLTVTTEDGRRCRFSSTRDFSAILTFKYAVPERIVTVSGQDHVADVAETYQRRRDRSEQEIIALYELFELAY